MKTVFMMPTPDDARANTVNSIHQIVLRLEALLPAHGWQLVSSPDDADLVVSHAGQQGRLRTTDVAIVHGLMPTALHADPRWFDTNRAVVRNIMQAREVVVPSEWVADILRRDMGIEPHVVGWGIDPDEWRPEPASRPFVLWNKTRADAVCDPAPLNALATRCPDVHFVTTFASGKRDNVQVIGVQPYDVMAYWIRAASVYLATTKETFGIGILEAMASGVPVLGYRWGNIEQLVTHGVNGFLAEPDDEAGLAKGLRYIQQHRAVLSANAMHAARAWTWERTAAGLASVLERALHRPAVRVTVVIPVFNYERYVAQAVQSVCQQNTDFQYEVLVVDDGSTDASADVAERALHTYAHERMTYRVIKQRNAGVSTARNVGIAAGTGEYVVCLDADDMLGHPDYLKTLAKALDDDRALGVVFTGLRVMNADGDVEASVNSFPHGYDWELQAQGHNQVPTCCMFRRTAWERAGGYPVWLSVGEDAHLWLKIGAMGYAARQVVEDGWFHYRVHQASLSAPVREQRMAEPNWHHFIWTADNSRRPLTAGGSGITYPVRSYERPLITVVIPVGRGHERIVQRALDSVYAQTLWNWECVLVNDTGAPLPIVGYAWARRVEGRSKNAAAARNDGVKAARAPLITFLDADDFLDPRFLEKTLRAYMQHGGYVYTDWASLTKDGKVEIHRTPDYDPALIFRDYVHQIHSINVLMERDTFFQAGGFDETMNTWEDVDFFARLATMGVCGTRVPEALMAYDYQRGQVRELGERHKKKLVGLLKQRYAEWITGGQKVCCGKRKPVIHVQKSDNGNGTHGIAGETVRAMYVGSQAGVFYYGKATRRPYGYVQPDETRYLLADDYQVDKDAWKPVSSVNDIVMAETVVPPPPVSESAEHAHD